MIDVATAEQVHAVALNMRDRDFTEFRATSFHDTRGDLADDLAARYGGRDDVLCGTLDGAPVCIGGTIETWPGVMTLLFFATPRFPKIGLEISRFIRNQLFPRYEAAGIHRIQAVSLAGYTEVHDWLNLLGLRKEAELRAFGKGGEDFLQFGRVSGVRASD
jgi:hypothetical protein